MKLGNDRLKHSLTAARTAQSIATTYYETQIDRPRDLFLLGLVHDIGYALCEQSSDHARFGGEFLRANGYAYWQEVAYHGQAGPDYASAELDVLNMADLCSGPDGSALTPETRLVDIKERHGPSSDQYEEAERLTAELEKRISCFDRTTRPV